MDEDTERELRDMKKGTEIKMELLDDGSWIATSPDYPEWKYKGSTSFGAADIAAKNLEWWSGLKVCPKCGRRFSAAPAVSREGFGDICPICGHIEALDPVDALDDDTKERLINELIKIEVQKGRVERMRRVEISPDESGDARVHIRGREDQV